MPVASLSTIKNWFRTNLKPSQGQFWDTWDSFWHKQELIPTSAIGGLDAALAGIPAGGVVVVNVVGSASYVLAAGRLMDVIVWEGAGSLLVGTSSGGSEIIDHPSDTPGALYRIDFYRLSATTVYFTGTGAAKIFIR